MKLLKYGQTGPSVYFLQNILQKIGYDISIDGIFGNNTKNAVIQFQNENGLTPDGIVGQNTWNALSAYIDGGLDFIVPTNIPYSYSILQRNIQSFRKLYPFFEIGSIGKSIMMKDIPYIKIGEGNKEVCYCASTHANEWITSPLLMKFLADFCYSYTSKTNIYGYDAVNIYNECTIYIVPMVNPDGVDLVTGELQPPAPSYVFAKNISNDYPNIPFPDGWKANIRGVDLNLQFPAGWYNAREIKYSQGFTSPAPRDFVGYYALSEPEALALYRFTLNHNFRLMLTYHTQGEVIFWQFQDYATTRNFEIGERFSEVSGYSLDETPYSSSFAGYKDWFLQTYRLPAYTIEAGVGENPLPISEFDKIYQDNLGILVLATILA